MSVGIPPGFISPSLFLSLDLATQTEANSAASSLRGENKRTED